MPAVLRIVALSLILAACAPTSKTYPLYVSGNDGWICFNVELANNPRSRAKGLMHRDKLSESEGMLFIYEQPLRVFFWMKNVTFPLDILFISQNGRIENIKENAQPFDETPIPSVYRVKYVLEILGGTAKYFQFSVGDRIRLPIENKDGKACEN